MLVLARHVGERIFLNQGTKDEIIITMLKARDSVIKVGIEAPPHVNIIREELMYRRNIRNQQDQEDDNQAGE